MKKASYGLLILLTFSYLYNANCKDMTNIQEEIWKDVVGYEGLYQVSNIGNVRSLPRNGTSLCAKILRQSLSKGYPKVNLSKNNLTKEGKVHRLMGFAFMMDTYFEGAHINHINGIKTDNRIDNFKWVTPSENSQHAWDNGLCKPSKYWFGRKGIEASNSKPVIQFDFQGNKIAEYSSATEASQLTNVSRQHISHCCVGTRKSAGKYIWKHK
jgi:hypothetical protein